MNIFLSSLLIGSSLGSCGQQQVASEHEFNHQQAHILWDSPHSDNLSEEPRASIQAGPKTEKI